MRLIKKSQRRLSELGIRQRSKKKPLSTNKSMKKIGEKMN